MSQIINSSPDKYLGMIAPLFGEFHPCAYYLPGLTELHIRFEDSRFGGGHAMAFDTVFDIGEERVVGFNIHTGGFVPRAEETVEYFLRRVEVYDPHIKTLPPTEWNTMRSMVIPQDW